MAVRKRRWPSLLLAIPFTIVVVAIVVGAYFAPHGAQAVGFLVLALFAYGCYLRIKERRASKASSE